MSKTILYWKRVSIITHVVWWSCEIYNVMYDSVTVLYIRIMDNNLFGSAAVVFWSVMSYHYI